VDAAYAGAAAICPELRSLLPGLDRADSLVVNPHKWLFTPIDCSLLFVRDPALLKETFSVVPEYLRTNDAEVTNLMDYGIQLGRRFRALKLWMVIRSFGVDGLRKRILHHCALARDLEQSIAASHDFEVLAPVPFSLVCFRALTHGHDDDAFNEALLARINGTGRAFLSHTRIKGRFALRLAIGNIRTTRAHVDDVWKTIVDEASALRAETV
jgi:aromatic-L-amino-acid decarboxylase